MAADDILVSMSLDISKVESQVKQVDKMLKNLNNGSVLNNINRAFGTVTNNLKELEKQLNSMAKTMDKTLGTNLRTVAVPKNVAKEIKDVAAAKKALADADLLAAKGEEASAKAAQIAARNKVRANEEVIASNNKVKISNAELMRDPAVIQSIRRRGAGNPNPAIPLSELDQEKVRLNDIRAAMGEINREQTLRNNSEKMYNNLIKESLADLNTRDRLMQNSMRMQAQAMNRAGGVTGYARGLVGAPHPETGEPMNLSQAIAQSKQLADEAEMYGAKVRAFPGFWDKTIGSFMRHTVQWGMWSVSIGVALAGLEAINSTMKEQLRMGGEFQKQGVLFQEYQRVTASVGIGHGGPPIQNAELLERSIQLARQWGDEINDVSQDLALWFKRTGDLNSAMFMTNEALKFQAATGTQVEDLYKTLTGLASQTANVPFVKGDKMGFSLADTPRLLEAVTAASMSMGAGLDQVDKKGQEMGQHLNNAAILILDAMDKDAAALGALHYSMQDVVAINAAMIQSFGNSGQAAAEAGDKIQRIIGGIAGLANKPQEIKKLADEGVNLNGVFNTGTDVLENLSKIWSHLNDEQKASLAYSVAGTRQFDALEAVVNGYKNVQEARLSIQRNTNEEDRLAAEMMGTYMKKVDQMKATWEGFLVSTAPAIIDFMSTLVDYIGNSVIPALSSMAIQITRVWENAGHAVKVMRAESDYANTDPSLMLTPDHLGMFVTHPKEALRQFNENAKAHAAAAKRLDAAKNEYKVQDDENALISDLMSKGKWDELSNWAKAHLADHPDDPVAQQVLASMPLYGHKGSYIDRGKAMEFLKNIGGQPTEPGGNILTNGKQGSPKGIAKDYQDAAAAVKQFADANAFNVDKEKLAAMASETHMKVLERMIKLNPENVSLFKKLAEASADYGSHLNNENVLIQKNVTNMQHQLAHAEKMIAATKTGTTEHNGWINTAHQLTTEIISQTGAMQQNKDAIEQRNEALQNSVKVIMDAGARTVDEDYSAAGRTKSFAGKAGDLNKAKTDLAQTEAELRKIMSITKDPVLREFIQSWISEQDQKRLENFNRLLDDTKSAITGLVASSEGFATKGIDALVEISAARKPDLDYFKKLQSIQKDYIDSQKEYQTYLQQFGENNPMVQTWKMIRDTALSAEVAAADYQHKVDEITSSPLYQAASKGIDTLVGGAAGDITATLFGDTAAQTGINNIDRQISHLEQLKSAEDQYYAMSKYHTILQETQHKNLIMRYDEEIAKLKEMASAQKDKLAHPSILKKAAEEFTKSLLDDMFKKMADRTLKQLFNIDENKDMTNALREQALAIRQSFSPAVDLYKTTTDNLGEIMTTWSKAVDQLNTSVNNLAQGITGAGSGGDNGFNFNFTDSSSSSNSLTSLFSASGIGSGGGSSSSSFAVPAAVLSIAAIGSSIKGGGSSFASQLFTGGAHSGPGSLFANAVRFLSGGSNITAANLPHDVYSQFAVSPGKATDYLKGVTAGASGTPYAAGKLGKFLGVHHGGSLAGAGSMAKYASVVGELYGIYSGFQEGGVGGGLQSGISAFELTGNPYIAAAVALIAGFTHHDDPHKMPDKYATQDWGQGLANIQGSGFDIAVMNANGSQFTEDSTLRTALGGKSQEAFIAQFIKDHPDMAKQLLSPEELAMFTGMPLNGGGITNGKDGYLDLSNGQHVWWQTLIQDANDATQAIQNYQDSLNNAANQTIVSINQFGASQGFFPYSWNTPGYEPPAVPGDQANGPAGPGTTTPPGSGGGGDGGDGGDGPPRKGVPHGPRNGGPTQMESYAHQNVNTSSAAAQPVVVQSGPVYLDGRVVARTSQAYQLRATAAGNNRVM